MDILHRIKALLHHPKPVQISVSHKSEHIVPPAAESMADIPVVDSVSAPDTLGLYGEGGMATPSPVHCVIQEPEDDYTPFVYASLENISHVEALTIAIHRSLAESMLQIIDQHGAANLTFIGTDWDASITLRGHAALVVRDTIETQLLTEIELPDCVTPRTADALPKEVI